MLECVGLVRWFLTAVVLLCLTLVKLKSRELASNNLQNVELSLYSEMASSHINSASLQDCANDFHATLIHSFIFFPWRTV